MDELLLTEEEAVAYAQKAGEKVRELTRHPYLSYELTDDVPSITDSKAGGLPYLADNTLPPLDKSGKQMKLLVQINCKDLALLEDFPHKGLLQFWVSTDSLMSQGKVTYIEEYSAEPDIESIRARITPFEEGVTGTSPVDGEYALKFTLEEGSISHDSEDLLALFCQYYSEMSGDYIDDPEDAGDGEYGEAVYDEWVWFSEKCTDSYFNSINGYPSSAQPVEYEKYEAGMNLEFDKGVQLLQLYSGKGVRWGDYGVGGFYMNRQSLRERDFSWVGFHWNCS
ncbi:MAG: DUF1963 domain-containing protein [Oscillospiraceae bacterium]|nr:DUF1963 domain-containing protein [Oscillospiraceae bacterium]